MEKMNVGGFEVAMGVGNWITLYHDPDVIALDTLYDWPIIQCEGDMFDNPLEALQSFNEFAKRLHSLECEVDSIILDGHAAVRIVHYLNVLVSRVNGYIEMVEEYISNREYLGQGGEVPDTSNMYEVANRIRKTFEFYAACTTELYRAGYFTAA